MYIVHTLEHTSFPSLGRPHVLLVAHQRPRTVL